MKSITMILVCLFFASCGVDEKQVNAILVSIETPIETPKPKPRNVGISAHGVTSYYAESNSEFILYFNQCCVMVIDGKAQHIDCDVYQTSPGVWVADFGKSEFVKINTNTGATIVYKDGINRFYHKSKTP